MRNLIIVASALLLVSCATSKGSASDGTKAGAGDHVCGPDCGCDHGKDHGDAAEHSCDGSCDHGEKHGGYHKDGMPEGGHTMENVEAHVAELFTKLDTDGDKALSKEEVGEHHLSAKFDTADADSDGKISHEEMMTFGKAMHSKMGEKKEEAPAPEAEATPEAAPEAAAE